MIGRRAIQENITEKRHARRLYQRRRKKVNVRHRNRNRVDVVRYRKSRNAGAIDGQRIKLLLGGSCIARKKLIAIAKIVI